MFNNHPVIYLKQLMMTKFIEEFQDFKIFVQQTPNLKKLTISMPNNVNKNDASHSEDFIKSSLHHLNTFKFKFSNYYYYHRIIVIHLVRLIL
jgi:hypothetical protein